MKKLRLALIYGGEGREHEVSRMSARSLLPLFDSEKISTTPVFIDRRGVWHRESPRGAAILLKPGGGRLSSQDGAQLCCDVAFPLLHGDFGEDGRIQGLLDCAHIPYVGCGALSGALTSDKILTKAVAEALGIPTVPSVYITAADRDTARARAEEKVGYPMFIKPSGLGSSIGCSLVRCPEEFDAALNAALIPSGRALVEEYLEGAREIECAYLNTSRFGEIFAPPGEVVPRGVYTYRSKYSGEGGARTITRAELSKDVSELLTSCSRALVSAIGIRQIARIDYFLLSGKIYLNEINTMPGFTASSLYPAMLEAAGIPLQELLTALVTDAYDRRF